MTALRCSLAVALAASLLGCATPGARARRHALRPPARESRAGAPDRSTSPAPGSRADVARAGDGAAAEAVASLSPLVGRRTIVLDGVDYGSDCAALVRAAFARTGHPLPADVQDAPALLDLARARRALSSSLRPVVGDLVFLADRPGGAPHHVGVVARADPDGTVFVLHRVARGVLRVRVNLAYPDHPTDPATGRHINDALLVGARPLPAGSLVVGVSDLLRRG